jgi:hypothetical protein
VLNLQQTRQRRSSNAKHQSTSSFIIYRVFNQQVAQYIRQSDTFHTHLRVQQQVLRLQVLVQVACAMHLINNQHNV